ncbi:MAG: DinB family protein [Planctomycetota bacterium]|nr:DinB family protein [Planctomycetota bacterium]
MREHLVPVPEGYDDASQARIVYMAGQLDDQLRRLKESVEGLDAEALEWQIAPGRNTIGMLLAHIAVAEVWWLQAGARGIRERDDVNRIVKGVIGIRADEDGLPLPEDGGHPEALRGLGLPDYLAMIDRGRLATHVTLRGWTDADLDESFLLKGVRLTKGWILYHVLEHMVAHYGQILLLKELRP